MKKYRVLILSILGVLLCTFIFAQDSTAVKIAQGLLGAAEVKWPSIAKWATGIATGVAVLSEILSLIPSIKANGVVQLVYNWLSAIFGSKKPNT